MKHRKQATLILGALLAAHAVPAQDQPAAAAPDTMTWDPWARAPHIEQPSDFHPLNRISGSMRFGLNISGKFERVGTGFNPYGPGYPTTTPDGMPYNYGDAYIYPDVSGSADGMTWNWGYDVAHPVFGLPGQVTGSSISMNSISMPGGSTSSSQDIDTDPGFEFVYNREIGIVQGLHNMHWGVEAAANYLPVSYSVGGSSGANLVSTTFSFASGTTPPGFNNPAELPYQGSFNGPGFLISLNPSGAPVTTTIPGSVLTVNDSYGGDLWGFRLGPYVEWPMSDKFSLHLSAGLAVGILDGNASWNEKLTMPGVPTQAISGGGSDTSLLYGGYFSGAVEYQFNRHWDAEAGVQFQDLGTYDHNFGARSVNLDFSQSIFILIGVSYHF